jgi:hypothetical protein
MIEEELVEEDEEDEENLERLMLIFGEENDWTCPGIDRRLVER